MGKEIRGELVGKPLPMGCIMKVFGGNRFHNAGSLFSQALVFESPLRVVFAELVLCSFSWQGERSSCRYEDCRRKPWRSWKSKKAIPFGGDSAYKFDLKIWRGLEAAVSREV